MFTIKISCVNMYPVNLGHFPDVYQIALKSGDFPGLSPEIII